MAFDRDPDACDSYEKNIGLRPIQIDVRDLLRMARAGWSPGPVDLLIADPPCAPWSRAGKMRGLDDDRDVLRETAELIALLRPRAYLIGNIPGLQDASSWHVVQQVIGGLSKHGYCAADFATLDAADFGVPQRRTRPFWYGHCGGGHICWPAPTHADPADLVHPTLPGVERLRPWVTCREALAGLPAEQLGRPVRISAKPNAPGRQKPAQGSRTGDPEAPGATLTAKQARVGAGEAHVLAWPWHRPSTTVHADPRIAGPGHHDRSWMSATEPVLKTHPKHPINQPDEPSFTVCSKDTGGAQGAKVMAWPWPRPSTAVCAETPKIGAAGRSGSHGETQGANAIVLSEQAAAILQGFPPGWHFAGKTKRSRWEQIGQAVPVAVAAALGRSVAAALKTS